MLSRRYFRRRRSCCVPPRGSARKILLGGVLFCDCFNGRYSPCVCLPSCEQKKTVPKINRGGVFHLHLAIFLQTPRFLVECAFFVLEKNVKNFVWGGVISCQGVWYFARGLSPCEGACYLARGCYLAKVCVILRRGV